MSKRTVASILYSELKSKVGERVGAPRGEAHYSATITEAVVVEIRRLHGEGFGYTRISRAVGLSVSQVGRIVRRLAWAHVK